MVVPRQTRGNSLAIRGQECDDVAATRHSVCNRGRLKNFLLVALFLLCAPAIAIAQTSVLIFVSTECPVSNRYAPDIQRLYKEFAPKGVRFQLVYPNPADDRAAIDKHLKEYGYPASIAMRDANHALVKKAQATITPEAAVFDRAGSLVYRGRIDDRVVELGRERPAATASDLRDALTAVLSGKPVNPARTQAVGCFIADMR